MSEINRTPVVGRFAPSPSGRMHLGNVFTAVLSWLSVKSRGGTWILRIEDLDPMRSKRVFSEMIEEDLLWLGLEWDEGGLDDRGLHGPYSQSGRGGLYESALHKLDSLGITYPCYCTRGELMATNAPHQSDGRRVYGGSCRPPCLGGAMIPTVDRTVRATRLFVPDEVIFFEDGIFGSTHVDLGREVGDFVLRRGDGAWAYQLAVVVDDAEMGVTEVMRGFDLLQSSAQQIYLYRLLGYDVPEFVHLPLICNRDGQRLSKRDGSLNMEALRRDYKAEDLLGRIGYMAGLLDKPERVSLNQLTEIYDVARLPRTERICV